MLRRRFREESVTDLMMYSLLMLGHPNILVEFPNEATTGADMEWNFVGLADRTHFRLLIQSKQLYGDGDVWERHTYKKLFYRTGASGELQAVLLANTARSSVATYPLYAFYNPRGSCELAFRDGARLDGVNLADGYWIEALLKSAITSSAQQRYRRLGTIHHGLFGLADLFCPPTVIPLPVMALSPGIGTMPVAVGQRGIGFLVPPTPAQIRERLRDILSRRSWATRQIKAPNIESDVPAVGPIPDEVEEVLERRGRDTPIHPRRWRVTFISPPAPSTDEDRSSS